MHYQPQKNLLQNRIILVTGASDGIGREAALTYADYGASVILIGRNEEKLKGVAQEIDAAGGIPAAGTRWICSPVPLKRARSLPTASAPLPTAGWRTAQCRLAWGGSPDG
ncbi:protein YciK [Enterobacter cloacae]|uniref:Protein YciK n=1 Tax=Enterobacter cloacae TaxID=550 RepID=A0A377LYN6_ENTCL|nr:protein YciK [Enterobacter cloacae]